MFEPVTLENEGGSEKWAQNVDLLAASKLFDVNILVCSPHPSKSEIHWSRYVPSMEHSVRISKLLVKNYILSYYYRKTKRNRLYSCISTESTIMKQY
jgi:hypothetical protein